MRKHLAELEDSICLAEEETEEEKALIIRTQQVEKVNELKVDWMAVLAVGFKTAIEQLKIVNPGVELVTKGISKFYKVFDGNIQLTSGNDD